jgi:hypothetical protein
VSHFVGLDLGQSAEHTVLPQIRENQVPSTLSSALCPEKNALEGQLAEWLRWPNPTARKPWYLQQSTSMSRLPCPSVSTSY